MSHVAHQLVDQVLDLGVMSHIESKIANTIFDGMVDHGFDDQELYHIQLALLRSQVQGCVTIYIDGVPGNHELVTEEPADICVTTGSCHVERCPLLAIHSFNVNSLLDQSFQNVTVAFIRSEVHRCPLFLTLGVDIGYLQHLLSRIEQV